jgi:glycogen operon protein
VVALRRRQQRNFLTSLLLSQGVPMLLGGDEFSRSQGGNNNAWCQDNEISWFDWSWDDSQRELFEFTKRLIALRRQHPVFRRPAFLEGRGSPGSDLPDVWWMRPDGRRMTQRDWARGDARAIGVFLNGDEIPMTTSTGERVVDESFLLLFNAHYEQIEFKLPTKRFGARWQFALSTADPHVADGSRSYVARAGVPVESRSVLVLRRGW